MKAQDPVRRGKSAIDDSLRGALLGPRSARTSSWIVESRLFCVLELFRKSLWLQYPNMDKFFDRFKPKKKGTGGGGFSLNLPGMKKTFQGAGQSLGGSQPGKVIEVQLDKPGSLGMKIEKRPGTNSAIVAMVVDGSQADQAGLRRGDILCFQGSNGSEEILYDMFRELAASDQRPLCFEVRRVQTKASKTGDGTEENKSADAYARKQAMIAAAEKREKTAKSRTKPLPKASKSDLPTLRSSADRHREEAERLARLAEQDENYSEASKQAAAAAKEQEAKLAAELGYNPYETSRATAGQARNATVAVTHGNMQGSSGNNAETASIPEASPPPDLPAADETESVHVSTDFAHAFETCVTSNDNESVKSSFGILRKLIVNATTKGQQADEATAQKFRKVRLANAKIKAAVVDVEGALDLMMSVGFQLTEEEGESVLTFPSGFSGEDWLPKALRMMETYE